MADECRLVRPSAHRHGCEKRRIGLDEDAIVRDDERRGAHVVRRAERDDPRDRDEKAEVEEPLRVLRRPRVAVDDAPRRNLPQQRDGVVFRLARVDDDRQVAPPRLLELFAEELQLRLARLRRIVVVEPDLAPGGKART